MYFFFPPFPFIPLPLFRRASAGQSLTRFSCHHSHRKWFSLAPGHDDDVKVLSAFTGDGLSPLCQLDVLLQPFSAFPFRVCALPHSQSSLIILKPLQNYHLLSSLISDYLSKYFVLTCVLMPFPCWASLFMF